MAIRPEEGYPARWLIAFIDKLPREYALNCPDRPGLPQVRCQPGEAVAVRPAIQYG